MLINNNLNIHISQLLNTITSRLAITISNERLQRFLMQYPALFRLQARDIMIKILDRNRIFRQKINSYTKIELLEKIEFLDKNLIFRQKSNF